MNALRHQPEHMRPGNSPSYWSSGLPRPEHMLPDPAYLERMEAEADERARGLEMLGRGRRRRRPEPLAGEDG